MNVSVSSGTDRFADYFVISGLDLSSGLEPDRFAGELYLLDVFYMLQWNVQRSFAQQIELSYYLCMIPHLFLWMTLSKEMFDFLITNFLSLIGRVYAVSTFL
jgi:hypothetical protein